MVGNVSKPDQDKFSFNGVSVSLNPGLDAARQKELKEISYFKKSWNLFHEG
jgi:hypothetical protein